MHARSTTVMGRPGMIETGITHVQDVVMPQVRAMDGCVGLSMVADRVSGRCIVTTAWRDEAAMRATAESVAPMRQQAPSSSAVRRRSTSGRSPTSTATTGSPTAAAPG